jgi:hypothetical protein
MMRLRIRKDSLTTIAISFRMLWVKYLPGGGRSHAMAEKNRENHPHMRKFKLTREFLRSFILMYGEKESHCLGKSPLDKIVRQRRAFVSGAK